jgi:2-polyprenyl-6-hydroxyphenyl methylase/3-demethylubiquinone-9 3-methyltransferase
MSSQHAVEIRSGERFAFGDNWARFLRLLDDTRIHRAETSLQSMLEVQNLNGRTFLDIGSGSGLFSLAARRLGATVHSFDYDPQSVACTSELKRRFFPDDPNWKVESGSVLDREYLDTLGRWDIVYSWGVLHHTGAMWQALENVAPLVAPDGTLYIAIYNDQGGGSRRWLALKKGYNRLPRALKPVYATLVLGTREAGFLARATVRGKPWSFIDRRRNYSRNSARGMSCRHDFIDWIGGYPFEVAKPEAIFSFYRDRGFVLRQLKTAGGGIACNEFVFRRQ